MKKELDNSRIQLLMSKVNEFLSTLPKEMNSENGFTFLLLAYDLQNKVGGNYVLVDAENQKESLIQCLDKVISGSALKGKDKNPQEWEILNAIAEYIMRFCALYPELYENFKEGVEQIRKKKENDSI